MKTKLSAMALVIALLASLPTNAAVYRWKGGFVTDPHNFQAGRNWNPIRATPLSTDTLYFLNGVKDSVIQVPTETVSYLLIDSLTQVVMVPDSSGDTLKIGSNLRIMTGASLTISSVTDTMWLYVLNTGQAAIWGTMTLHTNNAASCHRLEAAGHAIAFANGGTFIQECKGPVFGSAGLDTIVAFQPAAHFINRGSGDPFGFAAGSNRSKVWWMPGSRYVHQSTSAPSLSGRRYADFEFDPGSGHTIYDTASGAAALACDSLVGTSGVLLFNGKFGTTINGDLRVEGAAMLTSFPTVPVTWSFTGSGDQRIKGAGAISLQPGTKLTVNKPSGGLYLMRDFQVMDTTTFTNGLIYAGSDTFYNSMDHPVVNWTNTSYVIGNCKLNAPLGNSILGFPVGTANGSSDLTVWTNTVTAGGKTMTVSAVQGVHPDAPVPSQTLQRYWHLSSDLAPGLNCSPCEARFHYRSADFNAGFTEASDESTMVAGNYNGGTWTYPGISGRGATGPGGFITLYPLTTYGDFTMAKRLASFDTTKPRIITRYPANNAQGIQPYDIPYFMFSKPINISSFAFTINPAVSGLAACWFGSDTVELVHTGDNFQYGTTYTLKITAAVDSVGNPLAVLPDSIMFTTVANQGPQISMAQVPQDTYDSTGPFVVKAVVTDPAKSVTGATLYFAGSNDGSISSIPGVALAADTFRFNLGSPYAPGTVLEYYIVAADDQGAQTRRPADPFRNYQLRILAPLAPKDLVVTSGDAMDSLRWSAPAESLYYAATSNGAIAVPLGDQLSTRFTPQHDYYKLERAVSLWQLSGVYDTVRVHVYHDNGAGLPDTSAELVPPFKLKVNNYPQATVADLGQYGIYISTGDFHIAYESLVQNKPFIRVLTTGTALPRSLWDSSGTWKTIGSAARYAFSQAAVVSYSSYGKKDAKEVGHYEVYRDAGSGYSWLADDYDLAYVDNAVANGNTYGYQVRSVYPRNSLPDTFSAFTSPASVTTAVTGAPRDGAVRCFLGAARPNPMRESGAVSFGLAAAGRVSIEVYNIAGQRVRTLVDGDLAAGLHTVTWNGRNENGQQAAAGLYFYRMRANGFSATQKLLLVK